MPERCQSIRQLEWEVEPQESPPTGMTMTFPSKEGRGQNNMEFN